MATRNRTITDANRKATKRLRQIWDAKRKELHLTQESVALEMNATQGLVSQYLNGRIALGRLACMRFARILRVAPEEIRPDFEYSAALPDDMPPDVIRMAYKLASMPEITRRDIDRTIDVYMAASNYPALLKQLENAPR